jgi:hypothetical protein
VLKGNRDAERLWTNYIIDVVILLHQHYYYHGRGDLFCLFELDDADTNSVVEHAQRRGTQLPPDAVAKASFVLRLGRRAPRRISES